VTIYELRNWMILSVRSFTAICLLTLIPIIQVSASPSIFDDVKEQKPEKKPMDWSKPAVSRGFGYEAKTDAEAPWVGQYKMGQTSYFFGEHARAFEIWLPLAEKNYAEAQASIGWLYQSGLGVEQDVKKAMHYYLLASKQNHATAQNNLGVLYENGMGVESDLMKAREWYKKSAEQGYRFGEFNYANFLLDGLGGSKDVVEAISWYRKSADQNVKAAKEKLAELTH